MYGSGHGDLEVRCLVKKKEGAAGGVLGGGSFSLDEKGKEERIIYGEEGF